MPLTAALFAFWIVLSGKLDAFHLTAGAVSSVGITWATFRLLLLKPAIGPESVHPASSTPWLRLLAYIPWLSWQIFIASVQVAYVVLHPRLPIAPRMVRFHHPLRDTQARLTLANSITLTPGTVTVDVQGDTFLVHALTEASALSLLPEGGEKMQRRVTRLFRAGART
ncbi:MAG: Na+/H+ antiporter subunit E [Acidobacteriota bacterium]